MVSYEVEKVLSAVHIALLSAYDCDSKECPLLDVFEQIYGQIKEQNDTELLISLGVVIPSKKCKGCDTQKGTYRID